MAIPSVYSEFALGSYMQATLGSTAGVLEIDDLEVEEAVNDALLLYGVTDIALATDIQRLRTAARAAIWRMALGRASSLYQFSADGASYHRQEVTEHVRKMLTLAESDAAAMGMGTGGVWAQTATLKLDDPYRLVTDTTADGVD